MKNIYKNGSLVQYNGYRIGDLVTLNNISLEELIKHHMRSKQTKEIFGNTGFNVYQIVDFYRLQYCGIIGVHLKYIYGHSNSLSKNELKGFYFRDIKFYYRPKKEEEYWDYYKNNKHLFTPLIPKEEQQRKRTELAESKKPPVLNHSNLVNKITKEFGLIHEGMNFQKKKELLIKLDNMISEEINLKTS